MTLHILSSSSAGNGYILTSGVDALLIEAGAHLSDVKKFLDYKLGTIRGVLVSHEHQDHSAYVREYAEAGIDVLSHDRVFEVKGLTKHFRAISMVPEKGYKTGPFKIFPFEVHHDCKCYGFLISHPDSGNILFLTDTYMTEYTFNNLSHILIECNYSDEILEDNIINNRIPAVMRPRLLQTHMELSTCRDTILSNDITKVQNIVLIHLSNGNSNEEQFIKTIRTATGKPNVFAANKNMTIQLNKEPF